MFNFAFKHLNLPCFCIAVFVSASFCSLLTTEANAQATVPSAPADETAIQSDKPSKELLTKTLQSFCELLQAGDLVGASKLTVMPPGTDPEVLGKVIERREISLEGILILNEQAKFGTAIEALGERPGNYQAERANVDVSKVYAFSIETDDASAHAIAFWNGTEFKIMDINNIGELVSDMSNADIVSAPVDPILLGDKPTKALLIKTLKTILPLLEKEDYKSAAVYFALPPGVDPSELSNLVRIREISLAGIEQLERDAKFDTSAALYGAERAKNISERLGKSPDNNYGFKHESEGTVAEVVAIWESNRFKLLRLDDVGKLPGISSEASIMEAKSNETSEPTDNPTTNSATSTKLDLAKVAASIPELEKAVEANPNDLSARGTYAMALFQIKNYPAAWQQLMEGYKVDPKHLGINRGVDSMIGTFAKLGVFTVGVPPATVQGLLGEPTRKVQLGKNNERWLYGHWGVDFRLSKLHEIINLRGATEALFKPTEFISLDLDDRYWITLFRQKVRGKVSAFKFIPGDSPANFKERITIDRLLNATEVGTMEDIAKKQIADERKSLVGVQHNILESAEDSVMIAIMVPATDTEEARHQLVRLMKGPKDVHRLTYTLKSAEAPSQETQMKWFGIFKKAVLEKVK